jgi:hypothetical protein
MLSAARLHGALETGRVGRKRLWPTGGMIPELNVVTDENYKKKTSVRTAGILPRDSNNAQAEYESRAISLLLLDPF